MGQRSNTIFSRKIRKGLSVFVTVIFMFTFVLSTPITAYGYSQFTSVLMTQWGSVGSGNGAFNTNWGVGVNNATGNVYVADSGNNQIQKFDSSGNFLSQWGEPNWSLHPGYIAATYPFSPHGVASDSNGYVYATDQTNGRVYKFDQNGQFIKYWEGLSLPMGITIDSSNNIYVADSHTGHSVKKYDTNGNLITQWDVLGNPGWSPPGDPVVIAVNSEGLVYVSENQTNEIRIYTPDGQFIKSFGTSEGLYNPEGLAVDPAGYVYVADDGHSQIHKYSPSGTFISDIGTFNTIRSIAVDSSGNMYASDMGDSLIYKYDVGIFQPSSASFNINSGATLTSTPAVNLNIAASATPSVTEMLVSENQLFEGATWEPYTSIKSWQLSAGDGKKNIYMKFFNGTRESTIYQSSIILDALPPTGTVTINGGATATTSNVVNLNISATDAGTSVAQMMISNDPAFTGASWETFLSTKTWTLSSGDGNKTIYVKLKDATGNVSQAYSAAIKLDTANPTGSIKINNGSSETSSQTVTLNISATDSSLGSGISKMMISNDSNFVGSSWENYATSKSWNLTDGNGSKTVYIKFKDAAGNVSNTYSASIDLNVPTPIVPEPNPTPIEPSPTPIEPAPSPTYIFVGVLIQNGSNGQAVNNIQQKLILLGFDPGTVDGLFGPKTRAAIVKAQAALGLVPDGIVGPLTWGRLFGFHLGSYSTPVNYGSHKTVAVGGIQDKLIKLGFNPGTIDGIFGSRTLAAIKVFQRARGLVVDGIIGPITWRALFG